jgi:radical SAM protein with 4Fe4S-binding SPASM domain
MIKDAVNKLIRPFALRHMMAVANVRPIEINIETTSICPSRCVFCPNSKVPRNKAVMDMGLFNKICEDYYGIGGGAVGVCSMQSDIFSDSLLMERLALLQKFKDRFSLHTATMLTGASKLSDSELKTFLETFDRLDISMGGLSKDDYRLMYGIDAFDAVITQLFRIEKIVNGNRIAIKLVVNFRTNDSRKIDGSELLARIRKTFDIQEVRTEFFSWGGLIKQTDLPSGAMLLKADNSAVARKDCVAPWATLCVNVDGAVVGCGCVDWEARHIIGNIDRQTINEIWSGIPAKEFRTSFSRQEIPALCRDCSLYGNIEHAFGRIGLINYKPRYGCYHEIEFPFCYPHGKETPR